jgi:hypothetical protein
MGDLEAAPESADGERERPGLAAALQINSGLADSTED